MVAGKAIAAVFRCKRFLRGVTADAAMDKRRSTSGGSLNEIAARAS